MAKLRADATYQESLRATTEASRKVMDANHHDTAEEVRVWVIDRCRCCWRWWRWRRRWWCCSCWLLLMVAAEVAGAVQSVCRAPSFVSRSLRLTWCPLVLILLPVATSCDCTCGGCFKSARV